MLAASGLSATPTKARLLEVAVFASVATADIVLIEHDASEVDGKNSCLQLQREPSEARSAFASRLLQAICDGTLMPTASPRYEYRRSC